MPIEEGEHPILIPRPPGARPGGPAPWEEAQLDQSLGEVLASLSGYLPAEPDRSLITAEMREAAVLIPVYQGEESVELIFIKRPGHMPSHRGELAFPGGGRDESDQSLWSTALREAEEEIALSPECVEKVVELETLVTVGSRFVLTPFVGRIPASAEIAKSSPEVDRVLRVPIATLARHDVFREEIWPWGGEERSIYFFELDEDDIIWGATGRMVFRLLCLIAGVEANGGRPEA